ncbi:MULTISPECIES: DNA double-strand break repair protein Rad50 [unclassified Campylobacter]|uniref:DNA double-strand break repair protein Rad50 n=1 Tax=unclassified Campylobacter TaxID=2593542 RepID=UPI0022E9AF76|nr:MULTISPECIES: DNA double-strand break repair protein Rad50 [unclassified Campylobacter]MDA3054157.1 DNA double-strand break repair protein Rad50 [Campylobacter sp. VBCF_07 NA4]MDA3060848.1 DNA double-strand break repair protein Rad50 [Campylobacter sp. VBCF_02 NA5]MDA3070361.1 DNA double-strand break repair protein Rad50 [Campylobacter sp. VBCF_08 NA3]WBR53672.1 DNA double-strand break repair protein Rad50 [Campylobacter sp. VBCF_01 NA2]
MSEISVEKILVAAVVVGVVFYFAKMKDKSANAKPKISNEKPVVASNLWELKEKFKTEYFCDKLSIFARNNNIDDERIKAFFPKFAKTSKSPFIDWTKFTGRADELKDEMRSWNKFENFDTYDRYIEFLKEKFDNEIAEICEKIKPIR